MNTRECVAESLRIEGIKRAPTDAEVRAHEALVTAPMVLQTDLLAFVAVYEPRALLRDVAGRAVHEGSYAPPASGPQVPRLLDQVLQDARTSPHDAWAVHVRYERLHPFTDCNGRSGRALWYWCMEHSAHRDRGLASLGFLHAFYYQTLRHTPKEVPL